MKNYYIHNCHNTHTMAISEELAQRIINNPNWFVNQCGQDYDAESPNGKLFCIMIRDRVVKTETSDFDWTVYPTWM